MKKSFLTALVFVFAVASACGPGRTVKHASPGSRNSASTMPNDESPERTASNSLVEEGEQALDHGFYDRSADFFQEAVKTDPSNGVGYYYLALVKFRTGEYGEVSGFLEKASALLANDTAWSEKIDSLRQDLQQQKPE